MTGAARNVYGGGMARDTRGKPRTAPGVAKLSGTMLRLLRRLAEGRNPREGLNRSEQAAMSGTIVSLTRRKLIEVGRGGIRELVLTDAGRRALPPPALGTRRRRLSHTQNRVLDFIANGAMSELSREAIVSSHNAWLGLQATIESLRRAGFILLPVKGKRDYTLTEAGALALNIERQRRMEETDGMDERP